MSPDEFSSHEAVRDLIPDIIVDFQKLSDSSFEAFMNKGLNYLDSFGRTYGLSDVELVNKYCDFLFVTACVSSAKMAGKLLGKLLEIVEVNKNEKELGPLVNFYVDRFINTSLNAAGLNVETTTSDYSQELKAKKEVNKIMSEIFKDWKPQ